MQPGLYVAVAVVAAGWLWFLARGRARGPVKRVALRATLFAVVAALLAVAGRRGLFTHASVGFRVAILLALLTVTVGYLYLIRFCGSCGRMVRNLRPATCPRCGAWLPVHGMTSRVRRPGDDRRWSPLDKPQRQKHADGPRA